MNSSSPDDTNLRRAHPLALALIERLGAHRGSRVLELGSGRGRNTDALRAAGITVTALDDEALPAFEPQERFDGALSTHGFLHGMPAEIEALLARTAAALIAGAPFYATFASKRDARFGQGTGVAEDTFAADSGDEAGVPHRYFDETQLRAALAPYFQIESLREVNVDEIAGRWAHAQRPSGAVHFFVRAIRTVHASTGSA